MRKLTIADLKITLIAEPSDANAYQDLDNCLTKKQIARLYEKAEYNVWHWCDVEVRATWGELSASEYLGACSYKSEANFVKTSGYYDDMVEAVLADIQSQAERIARMMLA
jgi:biotin carboxylase